MITNFLASFSVVLVLVVVLFVCMPSAFHKEISIIHAFANKKTSEEWREGVEGATPNENINNNK